MKRPVWKGQRLYSCFFIIVIRISSLTNSNSHFALPDAAKEYSNAEARRVKWHRETVCRLLTMSGTIFKDANTSGRCVSELMSWPPCLPAVRIKGLHQQGCRRQAPAEAHWAPVTTSAPLTRGTNGIMALFLIFDLGAIIKPKLFLTS